MEVRHVKTVGAFFLRRRLWVCVCPIGLGGLLPQLLSLVRGRSTWLGCCLKSSGIVREIGCHPRLEGMCI